MQVLRGFLLMLIFGDECAKVCNIKPQGQAVWDMTIKINSKWSVLFCVFIFLVLTGCALLKHSTEEPDFQSTHMPNVILVTLDAVRADHLGCYGYERHTSPRIDEFAENGTLYTKSFAAAPWTIPTHASLFTGKYPFEHGAHTFKVEEWGNNVNSLHERHLTLAEVFKEEGYDTAAFVANAAYLSTRWQLNQGFDTYHVERVYALKLNEQVFKWLDTHTDNSFFLFINYIDVHGPFNTTPRPGLLDEPVVEDDLKLGRRLYKKVMPGEGPIPGDLVRKWINQYDTAVANLDEQVGALLDRLIDTNLYDDTIIVLTSDHGDFFGEHYLIGHSKDLYQEVLWVPLIIKNYRQKGRRITDVLTSSTDIPNLIFSQFPHDVAEQYAAVFSDAPGNHLAISENYYTRTRDLFNLRWGKRFNRVRTAVFDWPYKYIRSSDGKHELYHLVDDPKESNNLIEYEAEIADRLVKKLERFQKNRGESTDEIDLRPLTEENRKKLKSLGYIGD